MSYVLFDQATFENDYYKRYLLGKVVTMRFKHSCFACRSCLCLFRTGAMPSIFIPQRMHYTCLNQFFIVINHQKRIILAIARMISCSMKRKPISM